MTRKNIQATGNFLSTYYSDLNYIRSFHRYKNNQFLAKDYIIKGDGTFYSFLVEFKVARSYKQGKTNELLKETIKWVNGSNANNVDLFAKRLYDKGITHGMASSLASKILFLNNPCEILPMDRLVRQTVNQTDKLYSNYITNLSDFIDTNHDVINNCMRHTVLLTPIIEKEFKREIKNIRTIAKNRLVDKLLWTIDK